MNTAEIIAAFMKGYEKVIISEKQKAWLLSQAAKENYLICNGNLYFDSCHYQIKNCKTLASGGSYVGTRIISGKYNIEKLYYVRFKSTGLKVVCSITDIEHYKRENHAFEIISLKAALLHESK